MIEQSRILVVEDNLVTSKEITSHLRHLGYHLAETAFSGEEAIHKTAVTHPDLVLMDIHLGEGMDGTEAADHIRRLYGTPVVYLTAYTDQETLERAKLAEPFGYILKPFDERTLHVAIEIALHKHRAEETITRQKALLSEVFDNVQEGIALVDDCGFILFCNPAYAAIVQETSPDELVGQNVYCFFDEEARPTLIKEMKQRQRGQVSMYEAPLVSKYGQQKYVHLTVAPRFDSNRQWIGEFVTMLDMTDRKRMEQELRQAKDLAEQARRIADELRRAAEAASQSKGEFLASLSHELRSPLNAILGYSRLLRNESAALPPQQHDGLETIQQCAEMMFTLLNNVLDYSKLEAGNVRLHVVTIQIRWFVETLLDIVNIHASTKGVTLTETVAPDVPQTIQADEIRLRQVLMNMLLNAIKFTDEGAVTLRVTNAGGSVRFQVEDTGQGIAPEHLDAIFLPFQQAGQTSSRLHGAGLGLAICQGLLHLMESRMFVRSTPDQGSTFWFDLALTSNKNATGS